MRIGVLTAELDTEDRVENQRFSEEISAAGHVPVIINYRNCAVAVTEEGRFLHYFDEMGAPTATTLDAVIPRINEPDVGSIGMGMLALEVLISNGVYSTATPAAIELAKNKMRSQIALDVGGVPTPYSVAPTGLNVLHPRSLLRLIEQDPSKPLVIKTTTGTHGRGVVLGDSRRSAKSIVEALTANRVSVIAQEFVATPERLDAHVDLRLIVVGGEIVAAMKREASSEEDFRANLSLGAKAMEYSPTPRESELAIKATEVIGLDSAGVDILQSYRGPLVTEVNVSPGLNIEDIAHVNITEAIVRLAIQRAQDRATPKHAS